MSPSARGTEDWTGGKDGGWRVSRPNMHLNTSGTQQTKAVNPDARQERRDQGLGPLIFRSCPLPGAAEEERGDRNLLPGRLCKHFQASRLKPGRSDVTLFFFPSFCLTDSLLWCRKLCRMSMLTPNFQLRHCLQRNIYIPPNQKPDAAKTEQRETNHTEPQ